MRMNVTTTTETVVDIEADAVVVGQFELGGLSAPAAELNRATGGVLERLRETKEIKGKLAEVTTILAPHGVRAGRIVVVGLGPEESFDQGAAFRSAAAASKHLAGAVRERVAFYPRSGARPALIEAGVCGSLVGCQGQDLYRKEKKFFSFGQLLWATNETTAVEQGQVIAKGVNLTRRLVNEPPSEMYPEALAAEAERVAEQSSLELEVWDETRLEKEGCGSLLAVARGSARPPRLVILRYAGDPRQPLLALVGKGVTFDSGGLSLKPTDNMKTMKCDMAGAATVLGAMQIIAGLKLPVHVIGLMGLVENMISGEAYKLGDVLQSRNGKTIEVLNTDAEGRLVLADVLDVAVDRGAERIIDLATLTGACVVALGMDVAGLMTNDQAWCDEVAQAARDCGEPAWQLPMFREYGEQIRSNVADIKNVGEGRWAGAITAAKFLEEFVAEKPWVHIDIAGPSFLEHEKSWLDAGGSGALVRTLVQVARMRSRGSQV
jgi:leucyl aminopeptidase